MNPKFVRKSVMLNLFIDGTRIEMQPEQDMAVKDLLKEYIDKKTMDPEKTILICDKINKKTGKYRIIEAIPINVLFDVEKNNSKYPC
jgi:hypothetical protein